MRGGADGYRGMSPQEAARRFAAVRGRLPVIGRKLLTVFSTRTGARATQLPFMRDALGEPVRRSRTDRGPLRKVTGTHARAVRGGSATFSPGSVERITSTALRVTLQKGIDTSLDPGGWNEVRADRTRFRTVAPSGRIEARNRALYSRLFRQEALQALRGV